MQFLVQKLKKCVKNWRQNMKNNQKWRQNFKKINFFRTKICIKSGFCNAKPKNVNMSHCVLNKLLLFRRHCRRIFQQTFLILQFVPQLRQFDGGCMSSWVVVNLGQVHAEFSQELFHTIKYTIKYFFPSNFFRKTIAD